MQAKTYTKSWWKLHTRREYAWSKHVREKFDAHYSRDAQEVHLDLGMYMRRVNWDEEPYYGPDGKIYRDIHYIWYADFTPLVRIVVRICPDEMHNGTITFIETRQSYRHCTLATQALEYVLRDQHIKYAIVYRGDDVTLEFYRKHGNFMRMLPRNWRERFFPSRTITLMRKVGNDR